MASTAASRSSRLAGGLKTMTLLALLAGAAAVPGFRNFIPNGYNIIDPETGGGCGPVGHNGCVAGAPNNQFGLDFNAGGQSWTTDLCLKDSDLDGMTNGQELGDPCCIWTAGDEPMLSDTSHPGVASDLLVNAMDICAVCAGALPTDSPVLAAMDCGASNPGADATPTSTPEGEDSASTPEGTEFEDDTEVKTTVPTETPVVVVPVGRG